MRRPVAIRDVTHASSERIMWFFYVLIDFHSACPARMIMCFWVLDDFAAFLCCSIHKELHRRNTALAGFGVRWFKEVSPIALESVVWNWLFWLITGFIYRTIQIHNIQRFCSYQRDSKSINLDYCYVKGWTGGRRRDIDSDDEEEVGLWGDVWR